MDCHIRQSQILLTSHLTWIYSALLAIAQCATDSSFKVNNDTWRVISCLWTSTSSGQRNTQLGQQPHHHPSQQHYVGHVFDRLPGLKTYESSYWLWSVPSGILLTCRDANETESLYHGGELIHIVHSGNGHKWNTSVHASSMTGYKAGSFQTV